MADSWGVALSHSAATYLSLKSLSTPHQTVSVLTITLTTTTTTTIIIIIISHNLLWSIDKFVVMGGGGDAEFRKFGENLWSHHIFTRDEGNHLEDLFREERIINIALVFGKVWKSLKSFPRGVWKPHEDCSSLVGDYECLLVWILSGPAHNDCIIFVMRWQQ